MPEYTEYYVLKPGGSPMGPLTVDIIEELAKQGKTLLYFAAENGNYLGAIAAADVLKFDSVTAVEELMPDGTWKSLPFTGSDGILSIGKTLAPLRPLVARICS